MINLPIIIKCNQCGECCRHGADDCTMRHKEWSGKDVSHSFVGVCEFLVHNQCSIMLKLLEKDGLDALKKFGVDGICEFPTLRKE